jgi:hypothetical protein
MQFASLTDWGRENKRHFLMENVGSAFRKRYEMGNEYGDTIKGRFRR